MAQLSFSLFSDFYFHRLSLSNKIGIRAMESSSSALSVAQPLIPVFKGESYEFWSIRLKTILKSQDLWDLVERGFADPEEGNRLRDNKKKRC